MSYSTCSTPRAWMKGIQNYPARSFCEARLRQATRENERIPGGTQGGE